MSSEQRDLEDLVAQYLERTEAGEQVDLAELSGGDEVLQHALAEVLDLASALPSLQKDSVGVDRFLGQTLGDRYELERKIGQGAMGSVYRAIDRELQRPVAVKLLQRGLIESEGSKQRFLREAEICAQLKHPNIVQVFDRGETEDGTMFVVLELLEGRSLAESISSSADGALRDETGELFRRSLELCAEIAEGLRTAHAAGIVHRDVKPSNLFEEAETGRAVLLDFGIAGALDQTAGDLTVSGSTIGTPWYMPPEVAAGDQDASRDPRVDVYGLGATLYHLLSGRPPYEGDGLEVIARVQREDPTPLRKIGASRDVDAVVQKAMERRPDDRYPDVAEFEADLRRLLTHRPVQARPIGAVGRARRYIQRQPAVAALAVLTIVVLGLGSLSADLWATGRDRALDDEFVAIYRELPALLSIEGHPSKRLLIGEEERGLQREMLDRLLEIRPEAHDVRVLRAAVATDAGDRALASSDWMRLAETGDPYLGWVVGEFEQNGSTVFDTEGAPTPESSVGYFVRSFHRLRSREPERFESALADLDQVDGILFADDLRLLLLLGSGQSLQALEAAMELERRQGDVSARTAFVRGVALCHLRRYEEAIAPLRIAVALRPYRHGPNHNLGLALSRQLEFEEAQTWLERAYEIRPWLWNTNAELAKLHASRGEFAEALRCADRIAREAVDVPAGRRDFELANVRLREAIFARAFEKEDQRDRSAVEAERLFRLVLESEAEESLKRKAQRSLVLAAALGEESLAEHRPAQLAQAVRSPLDPIVLFNLAEMLESGEVSQIEIDLIRALLLQQTSALIPGSEEYRRAADELRESVFDRLRRR